MAINVIKVMWLQYANIQVFIQENGRKLIND